MFYYIISTTYQKIGDLFWPVHISRLSHSVTKSNCNFLQKNYDDFVLRMGKSASTYDLNTISDEDIKRKIIKLKSQIGTNILEGTVYIY